MPSTRRRPGGPRRAAGLGWVLATVGAALLLDAGATAESPVWYCEEDGTDCWRSLPPVPPPGTGPVGAGSVLARAGDSKAKEDDDKKDKKCDRKRGDGDALKQCICVCNAKRCRRTGSGTPCPKEACECGARQPDYCESMRGRARRAED